MRHHLTWIPKTTKLTLFFKARILLVSLAVLELDTDQDFLELRELLLPLPHSPTPSGIYTSEIKGVPYHHFQTGPHKAQAYRELLVLLPLLPKNRSTSVPPCLL